MSADLQPETPLIEKRPSVGQGSNISPFPTTSALLRQWSRELPFGVIIVSREGDITFINGFAKSIFSSFEAPTHVSEIFAADRHSPWPDLLETVDDDGGVSGVHLRCVNAAGTESWMIASVCRCPGQGVRERFLLTLVDGTQVHQNNTAARYFIDDPDAEGALAVLPSGRVVWCNTAASHLLGFESRERLSAVQKVSSVAAPADVAKMESMIAGLLQGRTPAPMELWVDSGAATPRRTLWRGKRSIRNSSAIVELFFVDITNKVAKEHEANLLHDILSVAETAPDMSRAAEAIASAMMNWTRFSTSFVEMTEFDKVVVATARRVGDQRVASRVKEVVAPILNETLGDVKACVVEHDGGVISHLLTRAGVLSSGEIGTLVALQFSVATKFGWLVLAHPGHLTITDNDRRLFASISSALRFVADQVLSSDLRNRRMEFHESLSHRLARHNSPESVADVDLAQMLLHFSQMGEHHSAPALMRKFDGISGLMTARPEELPSSLLPVVRAISEIARRMLLDQMKSVPVVDLKNIVEFSCMRMARATSEELLVICLDGDQRTIGTPEVVHRGGADEIKIYSRTIASHALEKRAQGLVIVHNHLSGDVRPSQADKDVTRGLISGLAFLDIKLVDHIIVAGGNHYSMREAGDLDQRCARDA